MIGEAKLKYKNQDLINLVKNDIFAKFGNRELAAFDLSIPGVFKPQARVTELPEPKVNIKMPEEQIADMHLPSGIPVPRAFDSIDLVQDGESDSKILCIFDRVKNEVVIEGGPVLWTNPGVLQAYKPAHWVGLKIGFPLGFNYDDGDIIPFCLNNTPQYVIIFDENIETREITIWMDAAYTEHNLRINWAPDYATEILSVKIPATLQDTAVQKIPPMPIKPIVTVEKLEEVLVSAELSIEVDLSLAK